MKRQVLLLSLIIITACSNSSDFETGEIKAIKNLREALIARNTPTRILDTRTIITRQKIDDAKIPVLFMELENGQNGTLTLYPGQGVGETWLGADGATVTMERGILKATRGMRNDVMGGTSSMPDWSKIDNTSSYGRQLAYLTGDNQIVSLTFSCKVTKKGAAVRQTLFDVPFKTQEFVETCVHQSKTFTNTYFVDRNFTVRKSTQYHGPALGYITIERLER